MVAGGADVDIEQLIFGFSAALGDFQEAGEILGDTIFDDGLATLSLARDRTMLE